MEMQNNKNAWIARSALEHLANEASEYFPHETGGVLMGYFTNMNNDLVIKYVTTSGPKAVHSRDCYKPDYEFDNSQVAKIYDNSERRLSYLGDWHSHIAPVSSLSIKDKRALRRIATCKSARIKNPIMLILSYNENWKARIWQGTLKKIHFSYKQLLVKDLHLITFG